MKEEEEVSWIAFISVGGIVSDRAQESLLAVAWFGLAQITRYGDNGVYHQFIYRIVSLVSE